MRFFLLVFLVCISVASCKTSTIRPLYTKWGKNIIDNVYYFDNQGNRHVNTSFTVLSEHPRPQLVRNSWTNLNGVWSFAITPDNSTELLFYGKQKLTTFPPSTPSRSGLILVPFSPETLLSLANTTLQNDEVLWYNRTFDVSSTWTDSKTSRVYIHFGAVDQIATVWVNGVLLGSHEGGYTPFSFEIPISSLKLTENELIVGVKDQTAKGNYGYGKQSDNRGGIWYTKQSGIWQTVWIERVPKTFVERIKTTPNFDESYVQIEITANGEEKYYQNARATVLSKGVQIAYGAFDMNGKSHISLPNFIEWTPTSPFLYDLNITFGNDTVTSYFGMRKFSIIERKSDKRKVLALNNRPIFHNGLLDQGYWSDGMYTPPHDDAMIYDIQTMKDMGFNVLRKHIKVEPLRWYYHCDRIGMLVWQDMVSGGKNPYSTLVISVVPYFGINLDDKEKHYSWFGRSDANGRLGYEKELNETISTLYNVVSLAMWVPFNEGWGQFDSLKYERIVRSLDPTRTIDHASGWHDQKGGDLKSHHVYFKPILIKNDNKRALAMTEFGGYSLAIDGHVSSDDLFGYKTYKTKEEFWNAYQKLFLDKVIPVVQKETLCATIYTQVSDVEDEVNGFFTYDREVLKVDIQKMAELNKQIGLPVD